MGLRRILIDIADRPGGRWLLSTACNAVSAIRGNNLRIHHDGAFWVYASNGIRLPRSRTFNFYDYDLRTLAGRIADYAEDTEDFWFHQYKPTPGDVIVDVGAEIGTDTLIFSRAVGPDGLVIAIEAQPETYEMLQSTRRLNGLSNVRTINKAVTDKPGQVRISSNAGVQCNFIGDVGDLVQADTLDNLLSDVPSIALLKMNIEGAERLAILGMDETVEKTAHLAIACHDFVDPENDWFRTLDKVSNFLAAKGFLVTGRQTDARDYVRYHLHAFRDGTRRARRASPRVGNKAEDDR
jgi:FkbM family methyltransferase